MADRTFDTVLNSEMKTAYTGTPEEIVKWLKERPQAATFEVCIGKTMSIVTVGEYLAAAKREAVRALVWTAMLKQDTATYHCDTRGMGAVADETTDEILKLL